MGSIWAEGLFYSLYQKLLDGSVPILTKFYLENYLRSSPDKSHSAERPLMGWVSLVPGGMGLWPWSFVLGPLEVPLCASAVEAVPPLINNKNLTEKESCPYHVSGLTRTLMKRRSRRSPRCAVLTSTSTFLQACVKVWGFFLFLSKKFPKVSAMLWCCMRTFLNS